MINIDIHIDISTTRKPTPDGEGTLAQSRMLSKKAGGCGCQKHHPPQPSERRWIQRRLISGAKSGWESAEEKGVYLVLKCPRRRRPVSCTGTQTEQLPRAVRGNSTSSEGRWGIVLLDVPPPPGKAAAPCGRGLADFVCHLGRAEGYPESWENSVSGRVCEVVCLEEISI